MSFGGSTSSSGLTLKSFVSEDELEEKRRKRQEEWEKVRRPDEPLDVPEEEVDTRSLYERLQEQKDKKQQEYEEKFKFSNQVRGLDEDEAGFLEFVSEKQEEINRKKTEEESSIMKEIRDTSVQKVETASRSEEKKSPNVFASMSVQSSNKKSQQVILAGAVKRKRSGDADQRQSKSQEENQDHSPSPPKVAKPLDGDCPEEASCSTEIMPKLQFAQVARIIGVLPGIGQYENSSDSESSSSIDSEPDFKLCRQTHIVLKNIKEHIENGE
ncbi:hypothetical protein CHS0354_018917 [Potamilus streckersoni]|uniref:FAM192A/Fyv6 N-terminal domain-containing protein n=1 Tax=Potamilus streckersoni TaxID=2493646 RepID=A0AAE0RMX7_9BIVA|nr:hypothetical protein CHS0354_018917 [Potamilus streckersoni]